MQSNLKEIIRGMKHEINIFHLLQDDELDRIAPYLSIAHYPKGAILFREGELGDTISIVKSGKVEVEKETEFEGKKIVLAQFGKGSFLGELAMFDELPRSATAIAVEDSELILLSRKALDDLIKMHPYIGINILKGIIRVLSVRLRKSADRLTAVF